MDTQNQSGQQADGYGDESLNTSSASGDSGHEASGNHHHKGGIHNNALYAAGMGRAATAQVDPHSNSGLAQTGTNISYEGPTAAGAGGSMGSGYTSGQPGTSPSIATDSDYEQAAVGKHFDKAEGEDNVTDENTVNESDNADEQR